MAKLSSKGKTICAIVLIIAIVAGIAVYFIFFADNDYVSLEDVGDEYVLDSVEVDGSFYVNEPEPDGTLIFRNDSGDEKKVRLNDDGVTVHGFSTDMPGEYTMSVTVRGVTKTVGYTVEYKRITYSGSSVIYLSIYDPIELDGIYFDCYDYNDLLDARMPLSKAFDKSDFNVGAINDYGHSLSSSDYGFIDLEYKVGYIGYGNSYEGKDIAEQQRYRYQLVDFVMDAGDINDQGTGVLEVEYVRDDSLSDIVRNKTIGFTWEIDYLADDAIVLYGSDGQTVGRYYYRGHRLELGAGIVPETVQPLVFELEYVGA